MTDQTELSLSEAMDATLSETMAKITSKDAVPVETHDDAAPATETGRERDASGRFVQRQQAAEPVTAEGEQEQQQEEQPVVAAKPAPGSWPKELKDKFGTLPSEVQDYMHRRESEISRTINNYSQKAKFADTVSSVLAPHEAILRADGADPISAISGLMNTYQVLRNAPPAEKAMAVAQMIQRFGVDLSLLGEDGAAGNSDPNVEQLYTRLGRLEQELATRRMADESAEKQHVESTIAEFATSHPHFESVRAHMGALLQAGLAKDMQDAYDQATMAVPEIRATLLQEQETKRREEAAKKAEAARKAAAINVKSRGILPAAKPVGTMEDTMREAYRRLSGG